MRSTPVHFQPGRTKTGIVHPEGCQPVAQGRGPQGRYPGDRARPTSASAPCRGARCNVPTRSNDWRPARLIDPRNAETSYVGKGIGNRLFAHVAGALADDGDGLGEKIERIRENRNAGLEVVHFVHRHGRSEDIAFESVACTASRGC